VAAPDPRVGEEAGVEAVLDVAVERRLGLDAAEIGCRRFQNVAEIECGLVSIVLDEQVMPCIEGSVFLVQDEQGWRKLAGADGLGGGTSCVLGDDGGQCTMAASDWTRMVPLTQEALAVWVVAC
jgi:hypothetical protein